MPNARRKKAARDPKHAITASTDTGVPRAYLSDDRHPDMIENPEKWEKSWAEDLALLWSGPQSKYGAPNVTISSYTSPGEAKVCAMETCILNTQAVLAHTVRTQIVLGTKVTMRSVSHDYEREWRALTDTRRKEIILKGICNAMHGGSLIPARMYCPDSTLHFLASRDGEQYLDYLHAVLPEDLHHPATEPKTIPHASVDRYLTISPPYLDRPGYKAMARTYQVLRTQCLTMMILEIFQVFVGDHTRRCPYDPVRADLERLTFSTFQSGAPFVERKMLKTPSGQTQVIKALQGAMEGVSIEHAKDTLNHFRETNKTLEAGCWRCGRARASDCSMFTENAEFKLQACAKCRTVGRTVLYCSK